MYPLKKLQLWMRQNGKNIKTATSWLICPTLLSHVLFHPSWCSVSGVHTYMPYVSTWLLPWGGIIQCIMMKSDECHISHLKMYPFCGKIIWNSLFSSPETSTKLLDHSPLPFSLILPITLTKVTIIWLHTHTCFSWGQGTHTQKQDTCQLPEVTPTAEGGFR